MTIRSVAILGAGTMGAQIAAHVANAGLPVLLLDLTADIARDGLKRARAVKPDHDWRVRRGLPDDCDRGLDHGSGRRAH
jgi:3-hydroxyacyl-CoA dehydrogenase